MTRTSAYARRRSSHSSVFVLERNDSNFVKGDDDMLALTRKRNEKILVGGNILITILDVRGDRVRVGVDAPKEIPIDRLEVAIAVAKESGDRDKAAALTVLLED